MWKYLCLLIFAACSTSPLVTGIDAEANHYYFSQIHKGMTMKEVHHLMGRPYWYEMIETEMGCYEVWYYITERTDLTQLRVQNRNLKPLFFKDGILEGWGYSFYFQLQDKIKKAKEEAKKASPTTQVPPVTTPPGAIQEE